MTPSSPVFFNAAALEHLQKRLQDCHQRKAAVFVVADSNTATLCLPVIQKHLPAAWANTHLITIPAGEQHKTLETAQFIWEQMTDQQAGRDALLINLGGGVVTDLGGFAASCFKRGIACINIPTTLLGMIDAAIGGKTGVDFQHFKNHIGTFYPAESILILPEFLHTLPKRELLSGFGELLKYGWIAAPELLVQQLPDMQEMEQWTALIQTCVRIKEDITQADPLEKGLRKVLNFGHTIGHAFESFALANNLQLTHGEAVACGMLAEAYLSHLLKDLPIEIVNGYRELLLKHFEPFRFLPEDAETLIQLMGQDKKNRGKSLQFVLVFKPGHAAYDLPVEQSQIKESLMFYLKTTKRE